ncbi:MAG: sigma 54-interacting transcriptional regulator, partial [Planctomycetes bacterium]|nr:sigma 54-interacting transcriptional regulator [Planctomycetota bacterium]
MIAYLVVREGDKWRDVYRLTPGHVMTIGRSPTNRIVVHDDICSRNHCEVFQSGTIWKIRDLQSRNGTLIDGEPVEGEAELKPGQVIQIGSCELAFTYDLTQAFPRSLGEAPLTEGDTTSQTLDVLQAIKPNPAEPTILHREQHNPFIGGSREGTLQRDRTSRELAQLYRLALEMGGASNSKQLAEVVLTGLASGTSADIGALLTLPSPVEPGEEPGELALVAYKSNGKHAYQRVSEYLSTTVLKGREAILARDVADDSLLVNRDSLGEIHAKSVICAPIRLNKTIYGLIHLYSTNPEIKLEHDDLVYTLAVADQCAGALENLLRQEKLADGLAKVRNENLKLREQLGVESELVGNSASMQDLKSKISRIAPTDATVLIRGESGVGKELVARAIHYTSLRRNGAFVCMNCAALTESLLESELFGHEKGSFTGATSRKIGKFEQAHKGTIFLDEVGEMGPSLQAKFLRVLEGHPFERVGGNTPIQVDVRVVAATNRDLEKAVEAGGFRKDLYFRLHVVEIVVDPLRDRSDDCEVLARHFLQGFAKKTGRNVRDFTPAALEKLVAYNWPGNVRELQNTVARAVILCTGEMVGAADIQLSGLGGAEDVRLAPATAGATGFGDVTLEAVEQQHILAVLDRAS